MSKSKIVAVVLLTLFALFHVSATTFSVNASHSHVTGTNEVSELTVTFDVQGGEVAYPESIRVTPDQPYGALGETSRTGYTFDGWWTAANGGGSEVTADTTVTLTEAHTLYAKWKANRYTVSFDTQGGEIAYPESISVTPDQQYGALGETSRTGYTFEGWWTDVNGGGSKVTADTTVTLTEAHTLYAKWKANRYTVSFDTQGDETADPEFKRVTYASVYGSLATVSRPGYTLVGWWTDPAGAGTEVTADTRVSILTAQTLYAKWTEADYTVTFDAQGGEAAAPASTSVTYTSTYGTLATTSRAGYDFAGWWTEAGGAGSQVTAETAVEILAPQTLYAKWAEADYTVTFDAEGGELPLPDFTIVTFNSIYGPLAMTSRTGYTFNGWWTEAGGAGLQVTSETTVAITEAHTLYAKWIPNIYVVSFDSQGGNTPNPAFKHVTRASVYGSLATASRPGYTLAGWWTEPAGAGTEVTADTTVSIHTAQMLYAKWTLADFTVTFDTQGGEAVDPASTNVTYTLTYGILPTPSRPGFDFAGWWTEAGGAGSEVTAETTVEITESQMLYAKWAPADFTVTFDAQGGETPDPEAVTVTHLSTYGSLAETMRTNHVFAGWWTQPGGTGSLVTAESTVEITAPQTLYAGWAADTALLVPVHRFWSHQFGSHFYIMGDSERDRIAAKYPGIWGYEEVAWYAYPEQLAETEPVHRFWSDKLGKHFYIMGDSERDRIAEKYRGIWNYEDVAWYAYPEAVSGTDPVGRFWSDTLMGHFYIITQSEIDRIAGKYPMDWNYEAIAYWAYTVMPDSADGTHAVVGNQKTMAVTSVGSHLSQDQRSLTADIVPGLDIVYPLATSDRPVAAYVYDSVADAWACVLPVTDAPASVVLENVQPDCHYLLDVCVEDSDGGEMVSVHQSSFEYQLDPPETLHTDSGVVTEGFYDASNSPTVRFQVPECEGTLTVKLYSASRGVVETLTDVQGGGTVEFAIPEWNCWYWISGWDDAGNELVLSIWLRQERE